MSCVEIVEKLYMLVEYCTYYWKNCTFCWKNCTLSGKIVFLAGYHVLFFWKNHTLRVEENLSEYVASGEKNTNIR